MSWRVDVKEASYEPCYKALNLLQMANVNPKVTMHVLCGTNISKLKLRCLTLIYLTPANQQHLAHLSEVPLLLVACISDTLIFSKH